MDITQKELKKLLYYDPLTGDFTWLEKRGPVNIGDIAGYITPKGYCAIGINMVVCLSHRLAFLFMLGRFPPEQVDHINHITNDNRWINLREVSNLTNSKNMSKSSRNTSGTTGVFWRKNSNTWKAQIGVNGKRLGLGCYKDINDAIKARKDAEVKYNFHTNHGV